MPFPRIVLLCIVEKALLRSALLRKGASFVFVFFLFSMSKITLINGQELINKPYSAHEIAFHLSKITQTESPKLRIILEETFQKLLETGAVFLAQRSENSDLSKRIVGMIRHEERGEGMVEICGVWSGESDHSIGSILMEHVLQAVSLDSAIQFLVTRAENEGMLALAKRFQFQVLSISHILCLPSHHQAGAKKALLKDTEDHASAVGKVLLMRKS